MFEPLRLPYLLHLQPLIQLCLTFTRHVSIDKHEFRVVINSLVVSMDLGCGQ